MPYISKTFYIIGNGFDVHHGIASKYVDFKTYLAKHDRDLLYALEHLYDCEDINSGAAPNLPAKRMLLLKLFIPQN